VLNLVLLFHHVYSEGELLKGIHNNKNCRCAICYRKHLSDESRKKISDTLKKNHPFKGEHLSDEWKENISKSLLGKPKSKEHNLKVSEAHKKRFRENPEIKLRYIGENNPAKQPGVGKKISEKRKGHVVSIYTKNKIRKSLLGRKQRKETKEKRKQSLLKSEKFQRQLHSREKYKKISESLKKKYREDKEYREKQISISCRNFQKINRPTSIEIKTKEVLNKYYPNEWIFTGTGIKTIGNLNPDFVHNKKKIVIEVNGLYWHNVDETHEKINKFKSVGYDCVVIWEDELKDKMYETIIVEKVSKYV
jgi:G:T-mismatch repair DNA endonuclease (very short patch repair protein)